MRSVTSDMHGANLNLLTAVNAMDALSTPSSTRGKLAARAALPIRDVPGCQRAPLPMPHTLAAKTSLHAPCERKRESRSRRPGWVESTDRPAGRPVTRPPDIGEARALAEDRPPVRCVGSWIPERRGGQQQSGAGAVAWRGVNKYIAGRTREPLNGRRRRVFVGRASCL